jgi:glycosyltransferase involved in cell wall biosynthesis
MHDFSTITGGCLFPKKCKRYYDGCGHCPQIGQSPLSLPFDLTRYYFKKHYKLLSSPNVTVISPSDFLEVEAKQGAARSAKIVRIDNPVDTEIFTPELRFEVRQELKLLDYHKAILFVASQIDDPRKGFLQFFEIYKQIAFKRPYWKLLLVGNFIKASNMAVAQNDYVHYLGSIVDSSVLSGIYAASDCTIISSVADNVPCIISESLSCGTPVVAMRIGGLTEMFKNGCHGIVIHDDNAVEWENALCALLEGQQDNRRTIIREYALARYGLKISINKHIELYGKTTLRQRKFEFISKCKTKLQ